jgi:hypothetical protein
MQQTSATSAPNLPIEVKQNHINVHHDLQENFRETHNYLSDFYLFPKHKVALKGQQRFYEITIREHLFIALESSKHGTFTNASNNGTTVASSHNKNYFQRGSITDGKFNHHIGKCKNQTLFVHIR